MNITLGLNSYSNLLLGRAVEVDLFVDFERV